MAANAVGVDGGNNFYNGRYKRVFDTHSKGIGFKGSIGTQ